jgi:hypothetical protein
MMIDGRTKPDVGIVDFTPFVKKPIADAGCSLRVPEGDMRRHNGQTTVAAVGG